MAAPDRVVDAKTAQRLLALGNTVHAADTWFSINRHWFLERPALRAGNPRLGDASGPAWSLVNPCT